MAAKEDILIESIQHAEEALALCLSNKFTEAERYLGPFDDKCMYHTVSKSTISFLQAVLTYEQEYIDKAHEKVKQASQLCDKSRKKQTWSETIYNWVGKPYFDDFTEDELHAELCYADCLLLRAMLTFIQDENLISFIKGGLKVRNAYNLYRNCMAALLQKPKRLEESSTKVHFESGVYMGMGSFNVLLSLLPARVLRLLEWVGFSGNKKKGLELLEQGFQLDGLRSPMCTITLLGYQIVVSPLLGIGDTDIPYSQSILDVYLKKFPESSIFLYFAGRIKQTQNFLDEALQLYEESVSLNIDWQQVHHICYWEMMWCYSFKGQWFKAAEYAEKLSIESKWSKSSYLYMRASFLLMHQFELRHGNVEQVKQAECMTKNIEAILNDVSKYKQRIAGKSIPFEKFAVCRVEKYKATGTLVLPALEIIHIWNGFSMFSSHEKTLEHFLHLTQLAMDELEVSEDGSKHYKDNVCICKLIQGICLRYLKQTDEAIIVLNEVASSPASSHSTKMDGYLPPYASTELGFMYRSLNENTKALHQLQHTLKHYSKYGLESRLHFRVHSGIQSLKELIQKETGADEKLDESAGEEDEFFDINCEGNSSAGKAEDGDVTEQVKWNGYPSDDPVLTKISEETQEVNKSSVVVQKLSPNVNGVYHKNTNSSTDDKTELEEHSKKSPRLSWFRKKPSKPESPPFHTPSTSPTLSAASADISPVHSYRLSTSPKTAKNLVTSL